MQFLYSLVLRFLNFLGGKSHLEIMEQQKNYYLTSHSTNNIALMWIFLEEKSQSVLEWFCKEDLVDDQLQWAFYRAVISTNGGTEKQEDSLFSKMWKIYRYDWKSLKADRRGQENHRHHLHSWYLKLIGTGRDDSAMPDLNFSLFILCGRVE